VHDIVANEALSLATTGTDLFATPVVLMTNLATGQASQQFGTVAPPGAAAGLVSQFLYPGLDGVARSATTPSTLLKGGPGGDALQVLGGANVLDGASGSNFLVGGDGTDGGADTFFLDGRGGADTWSTIVDFHARDAVTIFGFHAGLCTLPFTASDGASGYTGLTIYSELNGPGTGIDASLTFAGLSQADADTHFAISTGTLSPGTTDATDYLEIQYKA